jgi:hypothetical protein
VAASVAANILHARPNPISQMIAAWPPLALLLTVELISRVPTHRRSLAAVRLAATAAIAGIAAWVSYWHMVGVATPHPSHELDPLRQRCPCRQPRPRRSRGMLVLVENAGEAVASSYLETRQHVWISDPRGQRAQRSGVRDALMRRCPL